MRFVPSLLAVASLAVVAQAASAQDATSTSGMTTSLRGFRLEGNFGGDRFHSQGQHHDKFGYGGTIGFDGQIGDKIVIGPEGTYWRPGSGNENCSAGVVGGTVCQKSYYELGAALRAGYLFTPQLLAFAKGGWVTNEQRKFFNAPAGQTGYYNRTGTDGYQVGGGVEYTLPTMGGFSTPLYVSVQYVYSNYDDHTSRQRVLGGVGIRFK